jgi:hypothetical protein
MTKRVEGTLSMIGPILTTRADVKEIRTEKCDDIEVTAAPVFG